jgi:hypothetical protein
MASHVRTGIAIAHLYVVNLYLMVKSVPQNGGKIKSRHETQIAGKSSCRHQGDGITVDAPVIGAPFSGKPPRTYPGVLETP